MSFLKDLLSKKNKEKVEEEYSGSTQRKETVLSIKDDGTQIDKVSFTLDRSLVATKELDHQDEEQAPIPELKNLVDECKQLPNIGDELTEDQAEEFKKNMAHNEEVLFKPVREKFLSKTLPTFPIMNRIIFALNNTKKKTIEGETIEIFDDSKIDWEKVNHIIFDKPIIGDYNWNIPKTFTSRQQLIDVLNEIQISTILGGAWLKAKCKDCGEEFIMQKSEVDFYLNKKLNLPRRCSKCRDLRKGERK